MPKGEWRRSPNTQSGSIRLSPAGLVARSRPRIDPSNTTHRMYVIAIMHQAFQCICSRVEEHAA